MPLVQSFDGLKGMSRLLPRYLAVFSWEFLSSCCYAPSSRYTIISAGFGLFDATDARLLTIALDFPSVTLIAGSCRSWLSCSWLLICNHRVFLTLEGLINITIDGLAFTNSQYYRRSEQNTIGSAIDKAETPIGYLNVHPGYMLFIDLERSRLAL